MDKFLILLNEQAAGSTIVCYDIDKTILSLDEDDKSFSDGRTTIQTPARRDEHVFVAKTLYLLDLLKPVATGYVVVTARTEGGRDFTQKQLSDSPVPCDVLLMRQENEKTFSSKYRNLQSVLENNPKHKIVWIGDNNEQDEHVAMALLHYFPKRVVACVIRLVHSDQIYRHPQLFYIRA